MRTGLLMIVFAVCVGSGCSEDSSTPSGTAGAATDAGADTLEAATTPDEGAEGEAQAPSCGSLDEPACQANPGCNWIVASCPDEPIGAKCFDEGVSPQQPPCAPQPCRTYLNETDCEAQSACNWWPETCPGQTYTDRCRNVGFGSPGNCG
jgi:hypothetical protein